MQFTIRKYVRLSKLVTLFALGLAFSSVLNLPDGLASASRTKGRHKKCKYNKGKVRWGHCDPTVHVQTKVTKLVHGKSYCPKTRTYTKPCEKGFITLNGCEYIQISDWSECDGDTMTTTRTLELKSGDTVICNNTRLESKECSLIDPATESNKDLSSLLSKRKDKRRRKKNRKKKDRRQKKDRCKYKSGQWSPCDADDGLQTMKKKLRKKSSSIKCQSFVIVSCPCKAGSGMKLKGKKSRKDRKNERLFKVEKERKRSRKNRRKKKKNKKSSKRKMKKERHGATKLMLPPVGVRSNILSSSAINVSWVDISIEGQPTPEKRVYYLRYRQLNLPPKASSPYNDHFKTLSTPNTYLVIGELLAYTKYEFVVRSSNGEQNSTWSMMVWNITDQDIPGNSPTDPIVIRDPDSPMQVILSWQPPSKPNGIITGYEISYHTLTAMGQGAIATFSIEGNKLSSFLTSLIPGLTYDLSIRAMNVKGIGPALMIKEYKLPKDPAPVPVSLKVSEAGKNTSEVALKWEISEKTDADILGFVILYTTNISSDYVDWEVVFRPGNDVHTTVIENLKAGTKYFFKTQAHTSDGFGPDSNIVVAETTAAEVDSPLPVLEKPEKLQAMIVSSTAAILTWQDSSQQDQAKDMNVIDNTATYSIRYKHLGLKSSGFEFMSSSSLSVFVGNLLPGTKYEFSVKTSKGSQSSVWSVPVSNATLEAASESPPHNLTVIQDSVDPSCVMLSWKPPLMANGKITGYTIFYTSDPSQTFKKATMKIVSGEEHSLFISFLEPQMKYFFRVRATNGKGFSPLSSVLVYKSPEVIGRPPQDVSIIPSPANPYDAVVSWQPPSPNKRKIMNYTITHYTEEGKDRAVKMVPGSSLTVVIKDLKQSTTYHFSVQAHYNRGSGPHSDTAKYSIPKELI